MSESTLRPPGGAGTAAAAARPSVIQLVFREKGALYAAYMPFLRNGGMFVPTTKPYQIGDEIYLILALMDDPNKYPIAGTVALPASSSLAFTAWRTGLFRWVRARSSAAPSSVAENSTV